MLPPCEKAHPVRRRRSIHTSATMPTLSNSSATNAHKYALRDI